MCFCVKRKINPVSPNVNDILEFLAMLFKTGLGYSALCTARAAINSFTFFKDNAGQQLLVKRFMRGVFILRPALPR